MENVITLLPPFSHFYNIVFEDCHTYIIGERSEPLSMVFNDQPRDIYIYIWPMSDRTYVSITHAHVRMSV